MEVPDTRYAVRPDGLKIAYQAMGNDPPTVVLVPGLVSHLDLQWGDPTLSRMLRRLGSFSRLIMFDKPGTGASDPLAHAPTLEERVDDLRIVLDGAGAQRVVLLGYSAGGATSMLFASVYPDRVEKLVLYGAFARLAPAPDYLPHAQHRLEACVARFLTLRDGWGKGSMVDAFIPELAESELQRRMWATFERAAASPATATMAIDAALQIDVRDVLASVHVPTLVLHRARDAVAVEHARYLAEHIADARYVELDGNEHYMHRGDWERLVDELERFVTGAASTAEPDHVLATIMFTDIVGSTERAAQLGDHAWRDLLERHNALVRRHVESARGRVVKSTGDGMFATLPGPGRAIQCAQEICAAVRALGIDVRAGVHTGECELIDDDLGGIAVHIGARVCAAAGAGEVVVSQTVKDLVVGSGIEFTARGSHTLKGVPGEWRLFAASAGGESPVVQAAATRDHMTVADRATVRLARRAPAVLRMVSRVIGDSRQRGEKQ